MRVAVPFLISSLLFASLTFDVSQMVNQNFVASSAIQQNVVSLRQKSQRNLPEDFASNRGSGRRELVRC